MQRELGKRLNVYQEAGASFKSALGKAWTNTELAGYYGLGGLLTVISLPFKIIGYTLSTAFQSLFGTPKKQYKARMDVLRAEQDQANSFYKDVVRREKEIAEIARQTRTLTSGEVRVSPLLIELSLHGTATYHHARSFLYCANKSGRRKC